MRAPHPVFLAATRLDGLGQALLAGQPVAVSGLALSEIAAVMYAAATEIRELQTQARDAAQAQAGEGQVRHRRTGNLYTIVGRSKHKVLGERWVDTILYRNAAGEVFSRELDNFEASFDWLPALARAQAGASSEGQGEGA